MSRRRNAANLAWKLALAVRGAATPALLESYHTERDAVGASVLRASDRLFRAIASRSPLMRAARNAAFALVLPRPPATRTFLRSQSEIAIRYGAGVAVARDGGGSGVKTGLRAPDGPLVGADGEATPLMPVLAATPECYTLLLFGGTSPTAAGHVALARLAARVRERHGAFVAPVWIAAGRGGARDTGDIPRYTDPAGATHRIYGAKGATVYLVRPDGYVAFRGKASGPRAADTLLAHLGGVFLPAAQREAARSGTLVA